MGKLLAVVLAAVAALLFVRELPSLKRYMKIERM
jgi:hypothetical protein